MYRDRRPVFEKMNETVHVGTQVIGESVRLFHITLQESGKFELKIYGLDRKIVGLFNTFDAAVNAANLESDEFFRKRDLNG